MQTKYTGKIHKASTDGYRLTIHGSGEVSRKRRHNVGTKNETEVDEGIPTDFSIDVAHTPENAQLFHIGREVTVTIDLGK